jgi:hypothetical protein
VEGLLDEAMTINMDARDGDEQIAGEYAARIGTDVLDFNVLTESFKDGRQVLQELR